MREYHDNGDGTSTIAVRVRNAMQRLRATSIAAK